MSLHDKWLNTSRTLILEYHELQNTNRGPSVYLRGFLWNMVECVLRHRDYTVLCFDKASEWKSLIYTYLFLHTVYFWSAMTEFQGKLTAAQTEGWNMVGEAGGTGWHEQCGETRNHSLSGKLIRIAVFLKTRAFGIGLLMPSAQRRTHPWVPPYTPQPLPTTTGFLHDSRTESKNLG